MKKAFSSVFRNKSISDKAKDNDPAEKPTARNTNSNSVGSLNQIKVNNLPPISTSARSKNLISGSTPNIEQKSQISDSRPLSPSSGRIFPPLSSRSPRYSSDELSKPPTSPLLTSQNSIIVHSVNSMDNSRVHSVAKNQELSLICKSVPKDEDQNDGEPIVTSPRSPDSDQENSSPPSSLRRQTRSVTSEAKKSFVSDEYSNDGSITRKKQEKLFHTSDISIESNDRKSNESSSLARFQSQIKTGDSISHQQHALTKSSAFKMSSEELLHGGVSTYKSQKSVRHEEKNITSSATSSGSRFMSKSSSTVTSASSVMSSSVISGSNSTTGSPIITEPFSPNDPTSIDRGGSGNPSVEMCFQLLDLESNEGKKFFLEHKPIAIELSSSLPASTIISKFTSQAESLKNPSEGKLLDSLMTMNDLIMRARAKNSGNQDLLNKLTETLKRSGALDILIDNCGNKSIDEEIKYQSARLLEQGMSNENRNYIVDNGLTKIVNLACDFTRSNRVEHERVGTGLLGQLFRVSEEACKDVIKKGGLKAIVYHCRSTDNQTLRNCASALANLSLYGGNENHGSMIKEQAPVWLFPLAHHNDDEIAYYACLATANLLANKEIEAAVLSSGTHELIETFICDRNPEDFAANSDVHSRGQSKEWLKRLALVLESDREEARSLAAFHFAVEACIKQKQGKASELREIGVIERLRRVASSPNAVASKYACQALKTLSEKVPHKLSQQVPLWTVQDVIIWVKQIGFENLEKDFIRSQIDGDILLQLNENMLQYDLKIENGILRRRFLRELGHLKRITDYSSCDTLNLFHTLQSLGHVYPQYTYSMLHAGVDSETIRSLSDDQLLNECKIENSIHRHKIVEAFKNLSTTSSDIETNSKKSLDAFISYRRSNGSQLASLLKVHLQLRGFSVFIDIERLEAGKFDSNLLNSIKQAKNFVLVLSPNSLDRCLDDAECKDWVHKEIQAALQSKCNIIPIMDNFMWPDSESLPEDIRGICFFNGVRWIHEYQDACVDKLERFMRGELNNRSEGPLGKNSVYGTPGTPLRSYPRAGSLDGLRSPPETHS